MPFYQIPPLPDTELVEEFAGEIEASQALEAVAQRSGSGDIAIKGG